MAYYLGLYAVTLLTFLVLDGIWLGLVAASFYETRLGFLLSSRPNLAVAGAFYLLFVAGLLVFVVIPALRAGSWRRLVSLGVLFGLVTYATYDLTNLATVRGWPWIVTVVDLVWGMTVSTAAGAAAFAAGRRWKPA